MRGGGLPKPALGTIAEIDKVMKTITRMPALKERVCEIIQNEVSSGCTAQYRSNRRQELCQSFSRSLQPGRGS